MKDEDINWKENVGKFKVGDIIAGYTKGFWKILKIDTRQGYSSSGEAHVCGSYNPETKKIGKATVSWCSFFSKPVSKEIENQREFLQKKNGQARKTS